MSLREIDPPPGDGTIYLTVSGSELYGTAVGGGDRDEMGIYVEDPRFVTGLKSRDVIETRTQPAGVRSGEGDLDRVVYGLRKFARLAGQGNPTVLLLLYVPDHKVLVQTPYSHTIRTNDTLFVSKEAGVRFLGYLDSQRNQLLGLTGRKHTNRPELVDKYGFDCYLDDTEFLTHRGWLTYDEIGDEEVATVCQATGEIEFQRPTERVAKPYSGPILTSETRYSAWAVTPNHRMYVSKIQRGASGKNPRTYNPDLSSWGFRRADEITRLDWHIRVAGSPGSTDYPVSDAHLALVGAYVSEGCVGKRLADGTPSVLRIEQKDGGALHEIMDRASVDYQFRSYRYPEKRPVTIWTLADREVVSDLATSCGEGSWNKRLPTWSRSLSGRQANLLLDALIAGDGTILTSPGSRGRVYYTVSETLAGDVQALAVLAGMKSNVRRQYKYDHTPNGMYQVFIQTPDDGAFAATRGRDVSTEHVEDARIVCFTVPNETLVTRRHGKVAMHGNTKFAMHAVRLGIQGVELMENAWINLPMTAHSRELLIDIRTGAYTKDEVDQMITETRMDLVRAIEKTDLPETADWGGINELCHDLYIDRWREVGDI